MNNVLAISFSPDGKAQCLYSELINLQSLGELHVCRASTIEFNNSSQQWEVRDLAGAVCFHHGSRAVCLAWEHEHSASKGACYDHKTGDYHGRRPGPVHRGQWPGGNRAAQYRYRWHGRR